MSGITTRNDETTAMAESTPTTSQTHKDKDTATAPPETHVAAPNVVDDSDPDFDDLDANAPAHSASQPSQSTSIPGPSSSGPGRPADAPLGLKDGPIPEGPKPGESEEDFINRLSAQMSSIFANIPSDTEIPAQSPEDMAKMGKELEEFTKQMESQGVKPEDLLKAILGEEEGLKLTEMAAAEHDRRETTTQTKQPATSSTDKSGASFDDTIRKTMSRLNQSDSEAKSASAQAASTSEADMLAEMLKALDSGAGPGGDEGLSKMFLDMMQQLTQKDMLYEPMKELHDQYPDWLAKNKPPKIKQDDYDRYIRQSVIVKDITNKFEEPGYKDDKEEYRSYIWEKMQAMQAEGAPPEELVKNPFPGTELGNIPGTAGLGDEEGCPTQ